MGLMMALEIELGATLEEVAQTLTDLGACVKDIPHIHGGLLPGSKCGFGLTLHRYPMRVLAKGMKVNWTVGLTMTFHFRASNKMSSMAEIYPFIELFAEQHPHRFVLSFEYERVYAVRDEKGLDLRWPFSARGGFLARTAPFHTYRCPVCRLIRLELGCLIAYAWRMTNNREVFSEQQLDELLFGRGMTVQDYYIEQYPSGEMLCFRDSKGQAYDLHFNDDDMASAQMRRLKQLGVRIVTLG